MWYPIFAFIVACYLIYILKSLLSDEANKVKFYFNFLIFNLCVCFAAVVAIPYCLLNIKDANNQKLFTYLVVKVDKLINLKYQIRNEERLSEQGGAIMIGNHQSVLDTIGLSHLWNTVKYKITVTVKKELIYAIPFGPAAYLAGVIFLDRHSKTKSAYKPLDATKDLIKKEKINLWFFPEGTRNNDRTNFLPFKKGAFNLAVEAQIPILPVVFSPYYFIDYKKRTFNKGHIIIQCLEPVPTAGLTVDDVPDLVKQVYDKMTAAYKELTKEVNNLPTNNK